MYRICFTLVIAQDVRIIISHYIILSFNHSLERSKTKNVPIQSFKEVFPLK